MNRLMIKLRGVIPSTKKDKKLMAVFYNSKTKKENTIHFGAKGMDDYTITKNKEQRERYRKRHKKDMETEKNKKGLGAGALALEILWGNSTNLRTNIREYKKKYNL